MSSPHSKSGEEPGAAAAAGAPPAAPRPELLAPAGEPRALRAALAAGADAVYFGLDRWSARAFAGNFAGEAGVEAVETAHHWGARAYVALNTLLKDDELDSALAALEAPYAAGLDAVIVADLGFAARVREAYPDLPLHASTQLNTHSSAQLAELARLGFSRAILARELSLREIERLDRHGVELEVFAHGALCYGYSGDCLLASVVGGRSGNRGRCSQSCRMRYDLRVGAGPCAASGGEAPGDPERLPRVLSTSDLAVIHVLPQLLAAGVVSLKIEGRMKDAAYVGVITAVYRQALDALLADPDGWSVSPEWLAHLEQSFSRGFTTAHLDGLHSEVRSGGRGGSRGVLVGRVASVNEARGEVEVRLTQPVHAGDVVSFYTSRGQTEPLRLTEGARSHLTLRVGERLAVKDRLFRLKAAELEALAAALEAGRTALRPLELCMRLEGREGQPASLTVELEGAEGGLRLSVAASTDAPLASARTAALTEPKAREALAALGGTPYRLARLDFAVASGLFLAVGELKGLRRRAVAALDERRAAAARRPARRSLSRPSAVLPSPPLAPPPAGPDVVLVLSLGERPLRAPGVAELCLDLTTRDAPEEVAAWAQGLEALGLPLRVRLPEVLFDADEGWWRALLASPWRGVYARHLALHRALSPATELILEYPLQGLNGATAGVVVGLAARRPAAIVLSPEVELGEIAGVRAGLAASVGEPLPALEILAFGRQQVLHTRDQLGLAEGLFEPLEGSGCVALSLEDAKGYVFPGEVDRAGTRLFNARVTNLAANLDELRAAGVGRFLVVQSHLEGQERAAFEAGGLAALAGFVARERTTTGHLFRGVL